MTTKTTQYKLTHLTAKGHLYSYMLGCGYVERRGHATLWREHGVYHIRIPGWMNNPDKYWRTVRTLKEAYPILSELGSMEVVAGWENFQHFPYIHPRRDVV